MVQQEPNRLDLCGGAFVGEPKEDDSVVWFSASADKLAEVFVIGDHNPVFCMGFLEDFNVARTSPFLVDAVNLVTLLNKPVSDTGARAFVHKKSHLNRFCRERHKRHIGN